MTDLQPAPIDTSPSVVLEPNTVGETQNPATYKPDAEPEAKAEPKLSARQALEKAQADIEGKAPAKEETPKPEAEPKVKPEVKAEGEKADELKPSKERAPDGKFAPKQVEESSEQSEAKGDEQDNAQDTTRSSEARGNREPPARLLPSEREAWMMTPNKVRDGIKRVEQEYEAEIAEAREAKENWGKLKEFDDLAKRSGTTVPTYIENTLRINNLLNTNLVEGLDHIAKQYGVGIREIAQHVLQQPADQYQAQVVQQATQLSQQNQQLQQQLQTLDAQFRAAQEKVVYLETIQPFVAKVGQERFDELSTYIAHFLNSGMIPSSLNGQQKLEHAMDMAERLMGSSRSSVPPDAIEPEPKRVNPAGQKSIKGTPGLGATNARDKGKVSTRDAIKAAMSEMRLNT